MLVLQEKGGDVAEYLQQYMLELLFKYSESNAVSKWIKEKQSKKNTQLFHINLNHAELSPSFVRPFTSLPEQLYICVAGCCISDLCYLVFV